MKFLLELQSIINEALDFKKEAAKHMKDMHDKNATPAARAYAQKMLQRALEASKMKDKEAATKHYMGVEESLMEGSIKDAEAALAKHGQYKVDYEQKYGPMSGTQLHQHEVIRKQLLDKKRKAQSAYAKKPGVAEGFKEPTDIDGITKLLNHVLAHEEDYPMGYARRLVSALEKAEKKSQPDLGSHYKELRNKLASGSTKMPPMIAKLFSQNQKLFDMASNGKITPELKRIVSTWGESSPWGENTDTNHPEWIDGALEQLLKAYYPVWKEKQGLAEEQEQEAHSLKYEPMEDHDGSLLVKDAKTGKILGQILRPRYTDEQKMWRGYIADVDGKFRSGRTDFTAKDVESVKDFFELRHKRDLDEQGVAEAIPYALSAANANAEYERTKTFVPRGYKGRVDIEVSGKEQYLLLLAELKKLAKEESQHIEAGLSHTKMSIFSKTMDSDTLNEFVDMALEEFDQGVAEAKGELTYTPKFQTWAVIPKSRRQFVKYFQPHREEEARIFAQNSGGRLVKVDQMGRIIKEGKFTVNAKTGAKLDPRTGEELPKDEAPPASISTVSLKTLMQNRKRFPDKSPFRVQDEKIKKYLGQK